MSSPQMTRVTMSIVQPSASTSRSRAEALREYDDYFGNSETGVAIVIGRVIVLPEPAPLWANGGVANGARTR